MPFAAISIKLEDGARHFLVENRERKRGNNKVNSSKIMEKMFTIKLVKQLGRLSTKTGISIITGFLKLTGESTELPDLTN